MQNTTTILKSNAQLRRPRILIIAEAANPEWVSVPLIGWSLSSALADMVPTHLVTQVRNRPAILRTGLVEGRDFTAIDNEKFAARLYKLSEILRGGTGKGWTTTTAFSSLAYYSFEFAVWRRFKTKLAAREFDLVHRITPLSPTSPSIIARRLAKLRIPFVVGPLNGGVPWPKGFVDRQHAEREWLAYLRRLYKLMPGYEATRRYSSAIIVGSRYTYSEMPDWAKHKCVYVPENGVDLSRFNTVRSRTAHLPLRGGFVGRLVPYKGADMLLEAAAVFLKEGKLHLDIVGDGPQRPLLESIVDHLAIRDNVRFHGWLPHVDVQDVIRECDFLALPSVREFGGGVVLEAMALGVTPIVADYAGPSELINDQTGIRIPFSDKKSLVAGLHSTIADVIAHPERLDRLGPAGRVKVRRTLTWQAKAHQICSIYDAVLKTEPKNAKE